jgi:branched-chain amino acid transport system permease protein
MTLQILNIVTNGALLFVVALGLILIFGVMNVMNLAHGAFILLGPYVALMVTKAGLSPWLSFLIAPIVGILVGAVVELLVVRRLYLRPLDAILATFGLSIIITQVIILVFGRGVQFAAVPLRGSVDILGNTYSSYRLFTVGMAFVLAVVLWLVVRHTQWGLIARAVIMNEGLARALGINTASVRLATFSIGAGLAALAGAMLTPLFSVDPNMGVGWLVNAFMVALIAGPSIIGLGAGALLLGGSQTLAGYYISPVVGNLAIVLVAVAVLRLIPTGFAGMAWARNR